MITRLRVTNFKCFDDVDIELGGHVVFIGPNNSGKSSALQALTLWDAGWHRWAERWEKKDANGNLSKTPKARPGVTLNRRDLHAIPVPSAKLLWKNLHTHEATGVGKDRKTSSRIPAFTDHCGQPFDHHDAGSRGEGCSRRLPGLQERSHLSTFPDSS
jgi:hypothetical protein